MSDREEMEAIIRRAGRGGSAAGSSFAGPAEAIVRAADLAAKTRLENELSALIDRYDELFAAEINGDEKLDCTTRIYKWCAGNDLSIDWSDMTVNQMEALKAAIENAIRTEYVEHHEDF